MPVEMKPGGVYKNLVNQDQHGAKKNMNKEKPDGFDSSGIRFTRYEASEELVRNLKESWQSYVSQDIPAYPGHFSDQGIVICGGGIRYFTCAWVSIHLLRNSGCALPIELWYMDEELNEEVIMELQALNVVCKNVDHYASSPLQGYAIKPFAILNSAFKEVLFIDADNNCLADPTYLFDTEDYKKNGAVFWPDFWKTDIGNPIWKIVDATDYEEYEQESGQILIHKERCWAALNLCMYFNQQRDIYYQFLLGDKDTFKFAWKALQQPYSMIATPVAFCGYAGELNTIPYKGIAMVQHDLQGRILFIHQNLMKWDVVKDDEFLWGKIKKFKPDAKNRLFILEIVKLSKGRQKLVFDIDGDISVENFLEEILEKEKLCLAVLKDLRTSGFYLRFILYLYQTRLRT